MKQVVFAVFLIAMASLTGCLNEEDSSEDDEVIDLINSYSSPQTSFVKVDDGADGQWIDNDGVAEYVFCTIEGYQDLNGDGNKIYCDMDGHYDPYVPQIRVIKEGNLITIECIRNEDHSNCHGGYSSAYVLLTSIEGLRELIYCKLFDKSYGSKLFRTCEVTLTFEPAFFEVSGSTHYFGKESSDEYPDYYSNVVIRVF